nr:Unknown Function [uncultured bacterium]
MTKLTFIATTLGLLTASASAGAADAFHCESNMYRKAVFEINSRKMIIQDSYPQGFQSLEEALALKMGVALALTDVRLEISNTDLSCNDPKGFLVSCKGRTRNARLQMSGFIHGKGISGRFDVGTDIEIDSVMVETSLSTSGGTQFLPKGITLPLDQMDLMADAKIRLDGKLIDLKFTPFFYTDNGGGLSFCRPL